MVSSKQFDGRRGPGPGKGPGARSWWGLCEETPQLWASWLAEFWRRRFGTPLPARPPFRVVAGETTCRLEAVRLTFGHRWYFGCPRCGRRTEVLYFGGLGPACRRCNRLGYLSQVTRAALPGLRFLGHGRFGGPAADLGGLGQELRRAIFAGLERLFADLRLEPAGD